MQRNNQKNKKTLKISIIVACLMFGFSFALVPLYDTLCKATGLNGKIDISGPAGNTDLFDGRVDKDRIITVEFDVTQNKQMPWLFEPEHIEMRVHPGEVVGTSYWAKNPTAHKMTAQAIPSMTPWQGNKYFKKVQCFCFDQQTLAAGEERKMVLKFAVDPDLPKEIKRITLSYTLFAMATDDDQA